MSRFFYFGGDMIHLGNGSGIGPKWEKVRYILEVEPGEDKVWGEKWSIPF